MFRLSHASLLAVLLGACAGTAPPSAPGVVATAGHGKDVAAFHQDDADCRQAAAQALAAGTPAATPQQRYDAGYTQCMCAKGDQVELAWRAYPLIATGLPATIGMSGGGPR